MVFPAPGPVFQSEFILYGDGDMSFRLQMLLDNIQKALVRLPGFNIGLRILKYPDQADIVIITGQIRLNILKIPYMNRYIAGLHMAVCIDSAPLPGQIDAGHFPGLT